MSKKKEKKKAGARKRSSTNFGEAFTALRMDLGITQMEMAEKLGLTQGSLSKAENGAAEPRGGVALRAYQMALEISKKGSKSPSLFRSIANGK